MRGFLVLTRSKKSLFSLSSSLVADDKRGFRPHSKKATISGRFQHERFPSIGLSLFSHYSLFLLLSLQMIKEGLDHIPRKPSSRGDFSMRGFLVLARSNETCTGLLTAEDIKAQHLKAELAVLSCCQTGMGQVTGKLQQLSAQIGGFSLSVHKSNPTN